MEELKKFKLNNKILDDFDKLMTYHLDEVEEIEVNEVLNNSKIYNILSLCTNIKTLTISGDMRIDVNKILFNICKPERLETLILTSVKLPTTKAFSKFTNLNTISLNNIIFSDINGFFNKIENKDKIIALNLTNVDFNKKSISICKEFNNLKYFNIDGLKNCKFDDLDFIYENKNLERFEFYNNEIKFDKINLLCKGKYFRIIEVNVETSPNCQISNAFEINDEGEKALTVNTSDLDKCVDSVGLYKLNKLCVILEDDTPIENYIRKFKKVKESVTLIIKDISYLNIENVNKFRDKLNVEFINILTNNENKYCYPVEEYIEMRENFEKIVSSVSEHSTELDKFLEVYNYFKNNVKYNEEADSLKSVFVDKESSYNFYAVAIVSCLKALNIEARVIGGEVNGEKGYLWNQVKLDENWYNFDLGAEQKAKSDKKSWQYVFKGTLFSDEVFYKNHTPLEYENLERCYTQIQEIKKELKKKKISTWKRLICKIKGILKFNKNKALPAPEEDIKD
jgi:hypothetical protein